ncbi:hypothetical protein [Posidoniimonas corsicana]|uniref:hypothetical protein n=1 Tax=Posidoniimonas corsicana TaxID=1938618 RepID=UPI0011B3B5AE|nr:hypothetical protein [Posidoniimonas corsicana]
MTIQTRRGHFARGGFFVRLAATSAVNLYASRTYGATNSALRACQPRNTYGDPRQPLGEASAKKRWKPFNRPPYWLGYDVAGAYQVGSRMLLLIPALKSHHRISLSVSAAADEVRPPRSKL